MHELGQRGAATALIALLTLSLMAPIAASVVTAQGEEEVDEQEDEEPEITAPGEDEVEDEEEEIEREVEIYVGDKVVEIESTLEKEGVPGEIENWFEVEFSVEEEVTIDLEYGEEVEMEDVEREVELEFEVEFYSIIEFIDIDGDGLYDEDENISQYELEGAEFKPIEHTTSIVDNLTVHRISVQTTDGVFKVILHVAGETMNIGGVLVRPNEVKIDIEIHGYNYTRENSKLALKVELRSVMETEEEKGEDEDEGRVDVTSGNFSGFFSWERTAIVDGVLKPVRSTEIFEDPEEDERELYLIYERGNSIIHDPKIGVRGAIAGVVPAVPWVPVMPWILVFAAAVLAALISIGATKYIVLRKSR